MRQIPRIGPIVCLIAGIAISAPPKLDGQDLAKVDSTHSSVVLENARVRVIRVTYAPHEKGPMHSHPDYVVVCLTDGRLRVTLSDGTSVMHIYKAGQVVWSPATTHMVENVGETETTMMHIELKCPTNTQ